MIHKHPSVCCLWNYGAKLHLNRRQICNFPCYSTPLISDQRYLTVIQSEQAHSRVCTHVWASTSSLSEMRHTSTHMPRVCLRGDEQQYFSTASVSAPLPSVSPGLPGLAATRDLFTCSFVAELYVCLFAYVCVCLLVVQSNSYLALTAYSPLDMLERVVLLFALNSEVVVESRTPSIGRQFSQDVMHVLLHKCFFFQLWTQPERQVLSNNCIQTKYAETWFHKTFAQEQYNYSSSGKFTGRLIFITHVGVTAGVYVLVRSGCGSFHVNMCGGLGISFHTPSQVLL